MKNLFIFSILSLFIFSCSDDNENEVIWDKNLSRITFKGKDNNDRPLSFSFAGNNHNQVYISGSSSGGPVSDWFTFSKKNLSDNTVEITIYNVDNKDRYNFTGIIDNTGKTMMHIGEPPYTPYTTIDIRNTYLSIKDSTIFYKN